VKLSEIFIAVGKIEFGGQLGSKTRANRPHFESLAAEGQLNQSVRSDSPFTKRSGDMVYNSWLD
jgi:hypothetical protein